MRIQLTQTSGFSLIEMLATVAVVATVAAIAAPRLVNLVDQYRLGMSVRDVERELQFARLKSVSTQSPMRVRFNCPTAGQLRVVELVGTTTNPDATKDADTYLDRCNESIFPYRPTGSDVNRLTRPNNDGPVRLLQNGVTFKASQTLEFWPDGTVHNPGTGGGVAGASVGNPGVTITLTRKLIDKNITVNGLGKIFMDR
jgi:prepilin-type N-terminal cleavage/methylation domain-containing protein